MQTPDCAGHEEAYWGIHKTDGKSTDYVAWECVNLLSIYCKLASAEFEKTNNACKFWGGTPFAC